MRIGDLSFRNVEIGVPTKAPDGSMQAVVRPCKDFTAQQLIIESTGEPRRVSGAETADLVRIELTMQQASGGRWVVADGKSLGKSC